MRFFRIVVTSLAVVAGLIGALALMAIGFVAFVLLRLFGRPARMPRFQASVRRAGARPAYTPKDDVIDVTATRVNE